MSLYRAYFVPKNVDPSGLDLRDIIDGIIDGYATGEAARRPSPVGPLDLGEILSGQVDGYVDLLDGFAETGHPCNKYFKRLLTVLEQRGVKNCDKYCTQIEVSIDESTGTKNGKDCIASLNIAARDNVAKGSPGKLRKNALNFAGKTNPNQVAQAGRRSRRKAKRTYKTQASNSLPLGLSTEVTSNRFTQCPNQIYKSNSEVPASRRSYDLASA